MKEKIEQVIKELESSAKACMKLNKHDKADAYNSAVWMLREVLASDTESS